MQLFNFLSCKRSHAMCQSDFHQVANGFGISMNQLIPSSTISIFKKLRRIVVISKIFRNIYSVFYFIKCKCILTVFNDKVNIREVDGRAQLGFQRSITTNACILDSICK
eukprot:NODE_572_length_6559_cov_0.536842.p6 type:complete len:109 gc:universal NODE_572_length_6559_cov_0.536842:5522-5848(+)